SGGVDSSVAAILLNNQGYHVIGITMKLWDFENMGGNINQESGCCSLESFNDAKLICASIGIPHYVVDFSKEFNENVVNDFVDEYLAGRTPNPCVQCNTKIKWSTLLDKAEQLGADYIAAGHYAQVQYNARSKRFELLRGLDEKKDQSYALWGLSQKSLSKTLFPIGKYTKNEVRNLAKQFNLRTAEKSESQEICFIPDNNYHRLLKKLKPELQNSSGGNFEDSNGNVLGTHDGYPFYTIGQRKGLGGGYTEPMYVVDIEAKSNKIVIGKRDELFHKKFVVENINLIKIDSINEPLKAKIKIRYNDIGHPGIIFPYNNKIFAEFTEPQKSITPGQSAVFFDKNSVIGGGIIEKRIQDKSVI
ncbi:tRNA 2-thiouridine(34) synthase MnmA, partial [Calditrichota bacterium]